MATDRRAGDPRVPGISPLRSGPWPSLPPRTPSRHARGHAVAPHDHSVCRDGPAGGRLTLGYRWLRNRNADASSCWLRALSSPSLFGALAVWLHVRPCDEQLAGLPPRHFHRPRRRRTVGARLSSPGVIRDANLRSLAADSIRREAELAQLRSSLEPHFLLNTLHTIAALTVDEPLVARRLLAALGDLLRDALESSPEIRPLEADIHWLRRYAEILEVRHRGSLRFRMGCRPGDHGRPAAQAPAAAAARERRQARRAM
jgi:hypothetical protein